MARQHYVPQFYLKNFSISNREDFIYAYKRNKEIFDTKIKNIAVTKDIYTYKHEKIGKSDVIEKIFAEMEYKTSTIIKKLIETNNPKLTEDEKTDMAFFISRLYLSNLSTETKIKNFIIEANELLMDRIVKNRRLFKKYLKKLGIKMKWRNNTNEYKKIALEKISEEFSKKEYFFLTILECIPKLVPIIINKNWYILESSSPRIFVTSDNPVSLFRTKGLPENFKFPMLYGNNILSLPLLHFFIKLAFVIDTIVLPISPKRCLLLVKWEEDNIVEAPRYIVDKINKNTAFFANKFIFSNIESKDIWNMFNETAESEYEKFKIPQLTHFKFEKDLKY
jgi:hypothetical protein